MYKSYKLVVTEEFKSELVQTYRYFYDKLRNPQAAERLLVNVERAIKKRLNYPDVFEPYRFQKPRDTTYYTIQVGKHLIFYVLIDDIMEVRRFLLGNRNFESIF